MRHGELVADRSMRTAGGRIDLVLGEPVRFRRFGFRDPSAQDRGRERSASLWKMRDPHPVQMIDFGCPGAASVFEAVHRPAAAGTWKRRDTGTAQAIGSAVEVLLEQGLSPGRLAWQRVVEHKGRPMLVPDDGTGWPLGRHAARRRRGRGMLRAPADAERDRLARFLRGCGREGTTGAGLRHLHRVDDASTAARIPRVVGQIIELLEFGQPVEVRQVHLSGWRDERIDVVACAAREARLRGFAGVLTACAAGQEAAAVPAAFEGLVRDTGHCHVPSFDWPGDPSGRVAGGTIRQLIGCGSRARGRKRC